MNRTERIAQLEEAYGPLRTVTRGGFKLFQLMLSFHGDEPYKAAFVMARESGCTARLDSTEDEYFVPTFVFTGGLSQIERLVALYG